MNDTVYNSYSLTSVAAALTGALGVEAPKQAAGANPLLVQTAGKVDRVVVYNPDAVAMWLYQKYTALYGNVLRYTSLALPLSTVMPSVTPVCFGTMYTGALPEIHGITAYEKPVIRIDTVFDALLRAGKRCAIVSTAGDSMSKIFLERDMDYFILETTDEVRKKGEELVRLDKYDFLAVYSASYDTTMHRNAPEGAASIEALKGDTEAFARLCEEVKKLPGKSLIGFAPDHGCHEIDGGLGSHGLSMAEDINILHFYGIIG